MSYDILDCLDDRSVGHLPSFFDLDNVDQYPFILMLLSYLYTYNLINDYK